MHQYFFEPDQVTPCSHRIDLWGVVGKNFMHMGNFFLFHLSIHITVHELSLHRLDTTVEPWNHYTEYENILGGDALTIALLA